jgi:1-deoxy-D-xylulose-5-phosphate reductoisomerase
MVTINSATLVNKALELIEAHWLFGLPPELIEVVVHPQSIVHSMVRFRDGAVIAQASPPDMRLPIALALAWPERLDDVIGPLDFAAAPNWTFEPLDAGTFPAVDLARAALGASALHPAVLNGANEVLVEAFLTGRIGFLAITDTLFTVVRQFESRLEPGKTPTLEQVMRADAWARQRANQIVGGLSE